MAGSNLDTIQLDTNKIKHWRSIVTLLVFILTNINVLFPFHIPIYVPRFLSNATLKLLSTLRIIPPYHDRNGKGKAFKRLNFPMNFVTAPLVADLFLLAISAIGREEVHDGTLGANSIVPIDIMVFFITLAYIAISIDASGLIRYLAFKVLQKAGKVGHRLFLYLYVFFFGLGSFIGNDPIILSGTAFLAYMTRVSSNIVHPRAWIHTQFAIANIASAILVSSNPTNLVLAGAFKIKFIEYTANMIVPVVVTAIVLFPFLLYIIFADEALIPMEIKMHELSDEAKARKPVNPNIPNARGNAEEEENQHTNDEEGKKLSLEEIMNPFLDKGGAAFGAVIMTATLVTLLALNAASQKSGEHPVFWVTLPAAFVMFCWDVGFGWFNRHETREIARKGREEIATARAERMQREEAEASRATEQDQQNNLATSELSSSQLSPEGRLQSLSGASSGTGKGLGLTIADNEVEAQANDSLKPPSQEFQPSPAPTLRASEKSEEPTLVPSSPAQAVPPKDEANEKIRRDPENSSTKVSLEKTHQPTTLVSLSADAYRWLQETFPTVMAVASHLPFALVPFAFSMFVLVQSLVTKGWVPVFAYGWDHWVERTGTIGSIGGMGFLSVILCNFAGTNIGTTILLSRVIQTWEKIHIISGVPITNRTFWATVYSMALGVNYGAFSTAFSASLAGLLWRDILGRKHIHVRNLEFARVNLPIIAISMVIGCTVLVGEVYIMRDTKPYHIE